jgi:hypothetical protein
MLELGDFSLVAKERLWWAAQVGVQSQFYRIYMVGDSFHLASIVGNVNNDTPFSF